MRKIQVTQAKAHFAELLREVEHGKSFAITRHGKTVAHLVPAHAQDHASRQAAVEQFRRRRAGWRRVNVSIEEILAWRHEGHRPCLSERGGAQGGI